MKHNSNDGIVVAWAQLMLQVVVTHFLPRCLDQLFLHQENRTAIHTRSFSTMPHDVCSNVHDCMFMYIYIVHARTNVYVWFLNLNIMQSSGTF